MSDLDRLKTKDNLERAWRWIRSNPDATFKSYFRHLYRNYSVAENSLIDDLSSRLRRGIYVPQKACKLFFPKSSGILRPYSLLTTEDQIAYQAAANIVAEKLFPKVNHRYNKQVFGHLYAGKASTWFYRKWSSGYKMFNDAARKAYNDGLTITASFDLTACYDSIDHNVLRYFLKKLGLDDEFCQQLANWLAVWTATESGIYHDHGIPQGPLSSGLISEVALRHFDDLKLSNTDFRYFRYVDDIRLFARSEKVLRRLLVKLDLLSKDIGLFPQSGKIDIHEVKQIEKELKTVSNPHEVVIERNNIDQHKLFKRLCKLTPRFNINNPTRFKFLLAHAEPRAILTTRLWRIYERHPEIYNSFCNYLRRYSQIPKVPASRIIHEIKKNDLYQSVRAEFINVADGRLPARAAKDLGDFLKSVWTPRSLHPDLLARTAQFLIHKHRLTEKQIAYACSRIRPWWSRTIIIDELSNEYISNHFIQLILDDRIMDPERDVSLATAWKVFSSNTSLQSRRQQWNPAGGILLRELGIIQRSPATYCGIQKSLEKLLPRISNIQWKNYFGGLYRQAERQIVEVIALAVTNITAFVNALDVFNDLLLCALFQRDGTIGSYTLGNIGSVLDSNGRLAQQYPAIFTLANEVHCTRYESMYSHPRVRRTGKPTKKINYRFMNKARKLLSDAIHELANAGY